MAELNLVEQRLADRGFAIPRRKKGEVFTFVVEGYGYFPVDMLRYDSCYPSRQDDLGPMMRFFSRTSERGMSEGFNELRRVELRSQYVPTDDRWRSFGWKVVELR